MPAVVNISVELKEQTAAQSDEKHREPERLAIRAERHALRSIPQALFRTTVRSRNPAEKVMALGSGFIIDPADYIVTNNHIVANADKVAVIFR